MPKYVCGEDKRLHSPSRNCPANDDFKSLEYDANSVCTGPNTKRYLKYKFINDAKHFRYYNFEHAKQQCEALNSSLWEILDGQPEWNAVMKVAKDKDRTNLWLNAKVVEACPNNENKTEEDISDDTCKHNEALAGNGLNVQWPSLSYLPSHFSRLIRGVNPNDPDERCVYVDNNNEYIWDVHNCNSARYWGLCVKRTCLHSAGKSVWPG